MFDKIILNEAYNTQNDYSYYTNSTKKNVISVCVCVCVCFTQINGQISHQAGKSHRKPNGTQLLQPNPIERIISPKSVHFACPLPRKLQHTPRAHPRQSTWPTMKGIPAYSLLVKVARGVFQRCVEATLDLCNATRNKKS